MDKHHPTASMDSTPNHHALPQPKPEGPSDEDRIKAAFAMGQTGAPSSETERLAFESWMRGHSWLVEGVWNGTTYDDRGPSRFSSVDVGAMQTRMLWAAWRDRAALAQPEPEGATDEELMAMFWQGAGLSGAGTGDHILRGLRAVLARLGRPAIEQAPVSERPWEREGWCDADGRCWWGRPSEELCNSDWFLATRAEVEEFCDCFPPVVSLFHHALPVPKVQP